MYVLFGGSVMTGVEGGCGEGDDDDDVMMTKTENRR